MEMLTGHGARNRAGWIAGVLVAVMCSAGSGTALAVQAAHPGGSSLDDLLLGMAQDSEQDLYFEAHPESAEALADIFGDFNEAAEPMYEDSGGGFEAPADFGVGGVSLDEFIDSVQQDMGLESTGDLQGQIQGALDETETGSGEASSDNWVSQSEEGGQTSDAASGDQSAGSEENGESGENSAESPIDDAQSILADAPVYEPEPAFEPQDLVEETQANQDTGGDTSCPDGQTLDPDSGACA